MKKIKKCLRWLGLILLLILALSGIGIGAVIAGKKDQDYDNEIKTELNEGREEDMEIKE